MSKKNELNLAVLIDADNISYTKIESILNEVKIYGIPSIKRIYGDWTSPFVSGWKDPLLQHAITPIQQYSYTTGKNSTDSALIIDAMDILHNHKADGFCIVSSDSDFTRLAIRLRESGKLVIGIGQKKTPKPFIASCDKFIYVEIIGALEVKPLVAEKTVETASNSHMVIDSENLPNSKLDRATLSFLTDTVNDIADDNGWAYLADVGALIIKRQPDFDSRSYGFLKLTPLFKSLNKYFEIEEKSVENSKVKHIYIKSKEKIDNPKVSKNKTHTKSLDSK